MVEFLAVALVVTIFIFMSYIICLRKDLNQINEKLRNLKRYVDNLEMVIQHKFQCAESERQEILEKLERHIRYHN
nr:MAG TPA: protein of unknown function (DUF4083) [Caudoviricetes sp.]